MESSVDARYIKITPIEHIGGKKATYNHKGSGGECAINAQQGVVAEYSTQCPVNKDSNGFTYPHYEAHAETDVNHGDVCRKGAPGSGGDSWLWDCPTHCNKHFLLSAIAQPYCTDKKTGKPCRKDLSKRTSKSTDDLWITPTFASSVVFQRTGNSVRDDWFRLHNFKVFDEQGKNVAHSDNQGSCTSSYYVNDPWYQLPRKGGDALSMSKLKTGSLGTNTACGYANDRKKTLEHLSQANCLAKAKKIHGDIVTARRSTLIVGSWGHVPTGCSVQSGGDAAAHFNTAPGHGEKSLYTRVLNDHGTDKKNLLSFFSMSTTLTYFFFWITK